MTITIDRDVCLKLEGLHYEVESRKQIIGYMISANMSKGDAFDSYNADYQKYFIEYEKAKSELEKQYIIPAAGSAFTNWNLDFGTCELTINI